MGKSINSPTIGAIIATGVSMATVSFLTAPPPTVYISGSSVFVSIGVLLPVAILIVTFIFATLAFFGGRSYDRWRSYAPTIFEAEARRITILAGHISKMLRGQPDVYDPLCPFCLQSPGWDGNKSEWPMHCEYCGSEIGHIPRRWHIETDWLVPLLEGVERLGIPGNTVADSRILTKLKEVARPEAMLLAWLKGIRSVLNIRDVVLVYS